MPLIRVGEVNFNVEVEGPFKAPFLMLSNSLGTHYHMWDQQMTDFTKQFRVIRYDSRGHGRSHADEGPYSIASLGRDALAIMDALGVTRAHWVGLSMGGMVGQWILVNAPHRVERAVLANTGAQMGSPDLWNSRIRAAKQSGMAALTEATIARWFTKEFRHANPQAVARVTAMLHATPPQGYAASCAAIRDMDQREAIRNIQKPVLVVIGRNDPATPPALGKLIAQSIAGARTVMLNAAHLSNIEDAENFTRVVLDFLNGKEVTQPPRRERAPPVASPQAAPKKAASSNTAPNPPTAKKIAKQPVRKTAKKLAAKKPPAKKPAAKKLAAKKPAPKTAASKAAGKKASGAKSASKKSASKKPPAKKSGAKKPGVKKPGVKKTAAKRRSR